MKAPQHDDPLAINSATQTAKPMAGEVTIERDPETGAIIRVVEKSKPNPLNDPLNDLEEDDFFGFDSLGKVSNRDKALDKETDVTKQLEAMAADGVRTKPRKQSTREEDWVARLVEKHGDDYKAMFWDKDLNIYQQSDGDLKKRVKKWKQKQTPS